MEEWREGGRGEVDRRIDGEVERRQKGEYEEEVDEGRTER